MAYGHAHVKVLHYHISMTIMVIDIGKCNRIKRGGGGGGGGGGAGNEAIASTQHYQ